MTSRKMSREDRVDAVDIPSSEEDEADFTVQVDSYPFRRQVAAREPLPRARQCSTRGWGGRPRSVNSIRLAGQRPYHWLASINGRWHVVAWLLCLPCSQRETCSLTQLVLLRWMSRSCVYKRDTQLHIATALSQARPGLRQKASWLTAKRAADRGRKNGGRGGIRTPDTLSGTPVFKTGAINHSATLPS
jgi:hypothetical protein